MKIKIFIFISFTFPIFISAQSYITLHEDCNYGGKSYFLQAGTYSGYAMKIGNDKLSSIQIPSGMKVTVYEDENFRGNSKTFTANVPCLDSNWNDMTSSLVVESSTTSGTYNPNDYLIVYTDCYQKGEYQTLKPGAYTGDELNIFKNNISSFSIFGNLRVRAYTNSNDATGYFGIFDASQPCLSYQFNNKIQSLIIELRPSSGGQGLGGGSNQGVATFYTECNNNGNSIRLLPGTYTADKLGLFAYDISSVDIPTSVRVKAYYSNDASGNFTLLNGNTSCLDYNTNNKFGSLMIEATSSSSSAPPATEVTIYVDENYRGQSATLLPGSYPNMAQINFPDKAVSSVVVPTGYRVVIYEKENFGGKSFTLTDSRSSFWLTKWNDKTSSVKVYRDR